MSHNSEYIDSESLLLEKSNTICNNTINHYVFDEDGNLLNPRNNQSLNSIYIEKSGSSNDDINEYTDRTYRICGNVVICISVSITAYMLLNPKLHIIFVLTSGLSGLCFYIFRNKIMYQFAVGLYEKIVS